MTKLEAFVHENYQREFDEVRKGPIADVETVLTTEERTLIYKYTEDGFAYLNEFLRKNHGQEITEFGKLLDKVLSKLPNYVDIVYRVVDLTNYELEKYSVAETNNSILVEHSFVSASRSKFIAYEFGKSCQFRIFSKRGKQIESFAKYGIHHPQSEKEVLFRPNCRF
jgi:predicted house-cleaning noncanonical NTP pyrophosphatase (MazG superfamily)